MEDTASSASVDSGRLPPRGLSRRWKPWHLALMTVLLAAGAAGAVLIGQARQSTVATFYPAVGATVLVRAQGTGRATIPIGPDYKSAPSGNSRALVSVKYLTDNFVGLSVSCIGNKQVLHVTLMPGGENANPVCYPTGGGATVVDGRYKFPYPKRVVIRGNKGVRWSVIAVEPGQHDSGIAISPQS